MTEEATENQAWDARIEHYRQLLEWSLGGSLMPLPVNPDVRAKHLERFLVLLKREDVVAKTYESRVLLRWIADAFQLILAGFPAEETIGLQRKGGRPTDPFLDATAVLAAISRREGKTWREVTEEVNYRMEHAEREEISEQRLQKIVKNRKVLIDHMLGGP